MQYRSWRMFFLLSLCLFIKPCLGVWGWQPVDDDSVLWYAGPTGGHVYGVPEKIDAFKAQDQAYNNFKALPNGLFYWQSDFDVQNKVVSGKETGNPIVRPLADKILSYAWSEREPKHFVSYHNRHRGKSGVWDWGRETYVATPAAPILPEPPAPVLLMPATHGLGGGCPHDPTHLKRDNFFNYVMGMTEDVFLRKTNPTPIPAQFHAGSFEQISVGDLKHKNDSRAFADGVVTPVIGDRPYFNVVICTGCSDDPAIKDLRKYADVGALQARPENCGAVFQIASRFHTLEGRAIRGFGPKADAWNTLTHFVGGTQGEEAAISAAPGAIQRMYFGPPDINLLKDLGIKLNNIGMPDDPSNPSLNPLETNLQAMQRLGAIPVDIFANYNVGIQKDVQVISGLAHVHAVPGFSKEDIKHGERKVRGCNMLMTDPEQRVHQVLTAALNLSRGRSYGDLAETDKPVLFAQNIIQAGYEGTLRAAVYLGTPKVFLTLVGGGAFHNPLEWISGAIMAQKDFIRAHNLNVTLVFYKTSNVRFEQVVKDLSREIGGWVVEVGEGMASTVLEYPGSGAEWVESTIQKWEIFQSTHPAKQVGSSKLVTLHQSLTELKTKLGLLSDKLTWLKH